MVTECIAYIVNLEEYAPNRNPPRFPVAKLLRVGGISNAAIPH